MYGFSQQGMAQQQFLAQQALQAGNRTAAPGLPQPQQLPGVAGMQLHRAQHQQMQPQQQAGAEAHFEGVDLDDIPSDIEDEVPAGKLSRQGPWKYLVVASAPKQGCR
jgi:hypothetical protein